MKVTILQGIPGSGKSSLIPKHHAYSTVSADHHFIGLDGVYRFNPAELGEAHGSCLRAFARRCATPDCAELVVDNTNTTPTEVAPYYALAQAYGHEVRIIYVPCAPEVGAARNLHGVPIEGCRAMHGRLTHFEGAMPPWWNRVTFVEGQFDWETAGF